MDVPTCFKLEPPFMWFQDDIKKILQPFDGIIICEGELPVCVSSFICMYVNKI